MERVGEILKRNVPQTKTVEPASQIEYTCLICKDIGSVYPSIDGKVDYSQVIPCECQKEELDRRRRDLLFQYCDLPENSERFSFENYKPGNYLSLKEALKNAKRVADGSLKWLVLMSEVDLGKTHLAIAICREWLKRGLPAKFILVPEMLDWLREGYEDDSYQKRLNILKDIPLLVLDDLGTQRPTQWAMEKIIMLIDHRCINELPLVVTTNKPLNKLPGDDEGRIESRLKRFVGGKVIILEAPPYRTRRVNQ